MADSTPDIQLEGGTYEIIRNRLLKQGRDLRERLTNLNAARKDVFGAIENKLLGTDRITTDNNCFARDIVTIGDHILFGYNVHLGLRTETHLKDVFSAYTFSEDHFHATELDLIRDERFDEDFHNLYKYYRNTVFTRFIRQGPLLFLVFQIGKSVKDIKAFKFRVTPEEKLEYIDARSEGEIQTVPQHEFQWQRSHRDMQRNGEHPHVSILDRVFVETLGGSLTS